jgi:hypothetical protein
MIDWGSVVTGVLTGAITGAIPFLFTWRWRRQDRRESALASRRAALAPLAEVVAGCLANHELSMQSGHVSCVIITNNTVKMRSLVNSLSVVLGVLDTARMRTLVDAYLDCGDYKDYPGRAVERARAILAFCNG